MAEFPGLEEAVSIIAEKNHADQRDSILHQVGMQSVEQGFSPEEAKKASDEAEEAFKPWNQMDAVFRMNVKSKFLPTVHLIHEPIASAVSSSLRQNMIVNLHDPDLAKSIESMILGMKTDESAEQLAKRIINLIDDKVLED